MSRVEQAIEPRPGMLLVRKDGESEKMSDLIATPETMRRDPVPVYGTLLRAGAGMDGIYQPGLRIVMGHYAGTTLRSEGFDETGEVVLLAENEVLAVAPPEAIP